MEKFTEFINFIIELIELIKRYFMGGSDSDAKE